MSHRLFIAAVALSACWSANAKDTDGKQTGSLHRAEGKAPSPGTIFLYPERIPLENRFVNVERGMVFVPLNRRKPDSDVIGVEVYRFRSERNPSTVPPVFLLNGGPGFPGLADALESPSFFKHAVWPITRFIGADLVVVGQRGIGSSKPNTLVEALENFPLDAEVTPDEYAKAARQACEKGKKFWEDRGLDLSGFTVVEAAGDVNAVRQALGYDKIIISGESFGSHWGMAVMRYHPQTVERAVLSSLEGPDHTWDMPSYVLNSLKRIAVAADQDPRLEERIPKGGLIAALRSVIERLEQKPVVVRVKHPVSGRQQDVRLDAHVVRQLALGYTASVRSRQGMPPWPADIIALYESDYAEAARSLLRTNSDRGHRTASFFLLDCASGISRERKVQLDADPALGVLGPINRLYRASCPVWKLDLGDAFRQKFNTEIPTLLVHGTWDVSTPLENALELAPHFKQGKLVLVKGGSHRALQEALPASEAFRVGLLRFLQRGDMSALPHEVQLPNVNWKIP